MLIEKLYPLIDMRLSRKLDMNRTLRQSSRTPMRPSPSSCSLRFATAAVFAVMLISHAVAATDEPLKISGIYPHLAAFSSEGECGIGAVVPWAGKLWWFTYPPHLTHGSGDKLYAIGDDMSLEIRPESVGGTHACRMIHHESNQLIIGPYFIDARGNVRACDVKNKLVGRMTAVARHLTDPANKVYFYDMEGAVYEVDVHTLDVTKLFAKPVPGWHGKGGYTAQGRLVIANNGESPAGKPPKEYLAILPPKTDEDAGVLAEWDGKEWRVIERHQFTDVTGPGGIDGAPDDKAPLWAMGWDKRSVILKLLDSGKWYTYRIPKGSHAFDPKHGWFTEWPRIREVTGGHWLMVMHGQMFEFPKTFSRANTAGIRPLNTHLRYIPDVCAWNGRVVLAADDASVMVNPLLGQSQSNLWFGDWEDLAHFGPAAGWGGVWMGDNVKTGTPSDPFLVAGYSERVLHLSHRADDTVSFTIEADFNGTGAWKPVDKVAVPAKSYRWHIFPAGFKAQWVRVTADHDCCASAFFHVSKARPANAKERAMFQSLTGQNVKRCEALLRPAKSNRNLQVVVKAGTSERYYEVDEKLAFHAGEPNAEAIEIRPKLEPNTDAQRDAASIIVTTKNGQRWRLPIFDDAWQPGQQRAVREVQSERFLAHLGGIFYEVPRTGELAVPDYQKLRPVSAGAARITDFCTWRGLFVMSGADVGARPDGHFFKSSDGECGLWFGMVDDLWKLGAPRGHGGPWKDTSVTANEPSEPFLMTNFTRKSLALSHDSKEPVTFTVEVDFLANGTWREYGRFIVNPTKSFTHNFPRGFAAHWVRLRTDRNTTATAMFHYDE